MKQAKKMHRLAYLLTQRDSKALTPSNMKMPDVGKEIQCDHNWQRDGQTMMSIRWFCPQCGKTMLA